MGGFLKKVVPRLELYFNEKIEINWELTFRALALFFCAKTSERRIRMAMIITM